MKKVTIQEIAGILGLSRNTVAKALNDDDMVAAETREEVIRLAMELGYAKLAPTVAVKYKRVWGDEKRRNILLVSKKENASFWNKIIIGITDQLNEEGCRLLFNFIGEREEREGVLPADLEGDTEGMIILSVFSKNYVQLLGEQRTPMVFLDAGSEEGSERGYGDVLMFEGRRPVALLTEKLLKQGRRCPAFIGDSTSCLTMQERYLGFLDALHKTGIGADPSMLICGSMPMHYYEKEEVEEALDQMKHMPDLIVCANDAIAKYVILYLRKKEIKVPEEVWVTGFDNTSSNSYMDISLTTVDIQKQYMGRRLARQILWRITEPAMPKELIYISASPIYGASAPVPPFTRELELVAVESHID